jgi:hypothetical protein
MPTDFQFSFIAKSVLGNNENSRVILDSIIDDKYASKVTFLQVFLVPPRKKKSPLHLEVSLRACPKSQYKRPITYIRQYNGREFYVIASLCPVDFKNRFRRRSIRYLRYKSLQPRLTSEIIV